MARNNGVHEWNDPYEIVNAAEPTDVPNEQQQAILEAVITEYEDQHTTTRLDSNASFRLEQLTPVDDPPVSEFEFEVHRFIGGTPATRYSGHVHRTDDGWVATYEDRQQEGGLLDSVRNFLQHTSTE